MEWLNQIVFWHWWILAGMLLILELTSPVFFFLWLGFSAAAVGFLLLVFPNIPIEVQLVLFGILSVVAVLAWRKYREVHPPLSDQPLLNQRDDLITLLARGDPASAERLANACANVRKTFDQRTNAP